MMIIKLYLVLVYSTLCYAETLDFFQNEYDVVMDRMEVIWFNKSLVKDLQGSFVFYNRTQKVANGSFELLSDTGASEIVYIQLYKFVSNEYRFFPVTVSVNACREYERNTFNAKTITDKVSNVNPCNFKKGYYWFRNVLPDFSKFPPHIPAGLYKAQAICKEYSVPVAELHFFATVKEKPADWRNIPKNPKYQI